jgi:hypothetical protein
MALIMLIYSLSIIYEMSNAMSKYVQSLNNSKCVISNAKHEIYLNNNSEFPAI